jgi:hypothetical protein
VIVNAIDSQAESAILERAVTAENEFWSPEAARAMLSFKLSEGDLRRADELAGKAGAGTLTDEERSVLESYLRVGRLIEFMKAKALLSLKARGFAP